MLKFFKKLFIIATVIAFIYIILFGFGVDLYLDPHRSGGPNFIYTVFFQILFFLLINSLGYFARHSFCIFIYFTLA